MHRVVSLPSVVVPVVLSPPTLANTLTDKVVKVADGDTITVLDHTKQRYVNGD